MVRRVFVEKRTDVEAAALREDLKTNLGLAGLSAVRIIKRYDIDGVSDEEYEMAKATILSEPQVDNCYDESISLTGRYFAICYLPGQYDQRADSAAQCIQLLTGKEKPAVASARIIALSGAISDAEFEAVKKYMINPVEAMEASMEKPASLEAERTIPEDVAYITGFISMDDTGLSSLLADMGLAMDLDDLRFCRDHFREEGRDPSVTEIRMIDTYWSDHCRHTTFLTRLNNVKIEDGIIKDTYDSFVKTGRTPCLMQIATAAGKELRKKGLLSKLDVSEEINACSIEVEAEIDGEKVPYLVMFKNETHNHPTEIEPFGGAATCLGGAIRDPLSGRSYVYQAMRITGCADPRASMAETLPGKLPQRKISKSAAAGYSSYGNQIGLATGIVKEIYHPNYVAKRMELGAVIAAAPKENVIREVPSPGDVIILLGGRTGRDGCGGATGSSKAHTESSLSTCGAEVQKGNPPEERKIQRLFRDAETARMIKRCNDFGAGGVSVAIGELADGLCIDLDKVPKKYDGLDGTELAISESQERMAVVVAKENVSRFMQKADAENLEATVVAEVTAEPRLTMQWRGKKIVDLSRAFLNTNGAEKVTDAEVVAPNTSKDMYTTVQTEGDGKQRWLSALSDLNVCSQKGLVEMFDSSIGAGTVFMPYGGETQQTPAESMVAKLPLIEGETTTGTVMAHGYSPYLSEQSPFHGAVCAIVESVTKAVTAGADYKDCYLTLQEYFARPGGDPKRWGAPLAALLGAYYAQMELGLGAIGGKDSMSGTFNDIDVPPTLVSFAVSPLSVNKVVGNVAQKAGSKLYLLRTPLDANNLPDMEALKKNLSYYHEICGKVCSAHTITAGGLCEAISKLCFGNRIGAEITADVDLYTAMYGSILIETDADIDALLIGHTIENAEIRADGSVITLEEAVTAWEAPLEKIFPTIVPAKGEVRTVSSSIACPIVAKESFAKPRVLIPVFPGTNCEYDTARAFEKAGAVTDTFIIRNLTSKAIGDSVRVLAEKADKAQIIMLPGGFSGGDEPDGSGKFIATVFRQAAVRESVMRLLQQRDGLMLGICNGFQALIKLGLVPFGEIRDMDADCPTLTYNNIGRHVSTMVRTRIASTKSPWLANTKVGEMHTVAVSHGEGKFVANDAVLASLLENGQIVTQYVDEKGEATMSMPYNPNGSVWAIEGICSPDGRVLGKMAHSERAAAYTYQNIPGDKDQGLFASGVQYFR
ncbi:MAG: phosphoribosylformylglycinamidine synthase [Ruminococcaceae bacterium]|nr:phosphoribosylformylglycinamidine synthase [Oscillospiraceae bacterium]